jgi:hypothetical protein
MSIHIYAYTRICKYVYIYEYINVYLASCSRNKGTKQYTTPIIEIRQRRKFFRLSMRRKMDRVIVLG